MITYLYCIAAMNIWDALQNEAKKWSGAAQDPAPVKGGKGNKPRTVNGQPIPKGKQPVTKYHVGDMRPGVFVEFDTIEEALDALDVED